MSSDTTRMWFDATVDAAHRNIDKIRQDSSIEDSVADGAQRRLEDAVNENDLSALVSVSAGLALIRRVMRGHGCVEDNEEMMSRLGMDLVAA